MSYEDTHRPINDGTRPFQVYPGEIAHTIRDNYLHNIEAGQACVTEWMLPSLEQEAIARLRHAGISPIPVPDKRSDPEYWRQRWANEARLQEHDLGGRDAVSCAAVHVLLTAAKLRAAFAENADPQLVAALSMLLICQAIDGGFTVEYLATKQERDDVAAKHAPFAENSGRGEGPVKKLVRDVLPRLERKLKRNPTHLEVWHACAAQRATGIRFETSPAWGSPERVVPERGKQASWARFQVIISEVRKAPKT